MTAMLTLCDTLPQVSTTLVSLHQECLQGNFSRIQQLKGCTNTGAHSLAQSQQEVVKAAFWSLCLQADRALFKFSRNVTLSLMSGASLVSSLHSLCASVASWRRPDALWLL